MTQFGFSRNFGFKPPKQPKVPAANANGGLAFPHPNVPKANPGVPLSGAGAIPGTYNPAIQQKAESEKRGEEDTLQNIGTEQHFTEHDFHRSLTKIRTDTARERQKLGIDYGRGVQKIGYQQADTERTAKRSGEDFQTRLGDIARQFGELGHRQGEASNAAGVNDAGTAAASAAARGRNQGISEAPIHTAQGRLGEDLTTALERIGTARGQLTQDYGIAGKQLNQNRDYERQGVRTQAGRELFGDTRKEQRTKREGAIAPVNALEQEVWEGRLNKPGAYAKAAREQKKKGKR